MHFLMERGWEGGWIYVGQFQTEAAMDEVIAQKIASDKHDFYRESSFLKLRPQHDF
jgi:hypothetical protein